ncbi:MAG: alpha/beta hydrolase fold domain-containing protein [Eubacterium sp.]
MLPGMHGGGYIGGMRNAYRSFAGLYSELGRGMSVLTVDYRVAPEHPYPAALEDAITGYNWFFAGRMAEHEIVVAGDSAGGRHPGTGALHVSEESEPETSGGADLYVALDRSDPVRCIV